jgi:hypothetical protein
MTAQVKSGPKMNWVSETPSQCQEEDAHPINLSSQTLPASTQIHNTCAKTTKTSTRNLIITKAK